jgi:hypothetical protein
LLLPPEQHLLVFQLLLLPLFLCVIPLSLALRTLVSQNLERQWLLIVPRALAGYNSLNFNEIMALHDVLKA